VVKCNIFGGSKIVKYLHFCGMAHYRVTRENLERRTQLDEPVECPLGVDPLLIYKILHLLFFPVVQILCTLHLKSRKKIINMVLMQDVWNFSFFCRGDVSPTHSQLFRFVSGP